MRSGFKFLEALKPWNSTPFSLSQGKRQRVVELQKPAMCLWLFIVPIQLVHNGPHPQCSWHVGKTHLHSKHPSSLFASFLLSPPSCFNHLYAPKCMSGCTSWCLACHHLSSPCKPRSTKNINETDTAWLQFQSDSIHWGHPIPVRSVPNDQFWPYIGRYLGMIQNYIHIDTHTHIYIYMYRYQWTLILGWVDTKKLPILWAHFYPISRHTGLISCGFPPISSCVSGLGVLQVFCPKFLRAKNQYNENSFKLSIWKDEFSI